MSFSGQRLVSFALPQPPNKTDLLFNMPLITEIGPQRAIYGVYLACQTSSLKQVLVPQKHPLLVNAYFKCYL